MARRGFFSRVRQALRAVFPVIPKEKKPRRPPERPEPPKRRRPAPTGANPFYRIWTEETLRRPGTRLYRDHLDFLRGMYNFDDLEQDEQERIWREFVKFNQSGGPRRNDPSNPFWRTSGIPMDRFDWGEWRRLRDKAGTP